MASKKRTALERLMLKLLEERGTSTACPSEIARAASPEAWRALMDQVRQTAAKLQAEGLVDVYQRGRPVDPLVVKGPIRLRSTTAAEIDYRAHPELYRTGRGEEGVLTVEPYKSELLPLWRFRTEAVARVSARALYERFLEYAAADDFVGMDMARKYLQMGWTRARRYANHRGGRKYGVNGEVLPQTADPQKARAAAVFKKYLDRALRTPRYGELLDAHRRQHRPASTSVGGRGRRRVAARDGAIKRPKGKPPRR